MGRGRINPAWGFVGPALLAIGAFFFVPVAASLLLSFTDFDVYAVARPDRLRFVALGNYARLLGEPRFWTALGNTAYFVFVGGPLSVAVSLGAALLLEAKLVRWRGFFRTVFFLPVVTTLVAVAVVWRYLYHPRHGLLNLLLGLAGTHPIDWLGDPRWAMPAIILLAVWKNFGFNMVIFIAGLQSIPERLYEAARLDGASAWQQFRRVTLPLLAPTFLFVAVVTMIRYFQPVAEPYVMTQGGPANRTPSVRLLLGALVIPAQVAMLPLFLMLRALGVIDTYWGVIVPGMASVFGIFLVRQYALAIPDSVLDAARVDGAGEFRIYRSLVLFLCAPVLVTLAVFTFMGTWNDFMWPLIVLADDRLYTLPVALANLAGEHVQDTELMMAGAVLTVLPVVLLFVFLQRYYVAGIMSGGVKE